jgi:hypothetical protein
MITPARIISARASQEPGQYDGFDDEFRIQKYIFMADYVRSPAL